MKEDEWYKAVEITDILELKETRTKELLRELVALGELIDNGETKGKKYKKKSAGKTAERDSHERNKHNKQK